jgi:hypothetical protein
MPFPIPNTDELDWSIPLKNHLGQLNDPDTGGFNVWTITTRPTNLSSDNVNYTGFNSQTGKFERWDGSKWEEFSTLSSYPDNLFRTGTGTVTVNDYIVTGTGTLFTTELKPGCSIVINTHKRIVAKINSNTELEINQPILFNTITATSTITTDGVKITSSALPSITVGSFLIIRNQYVQLISKNGTTGIISQPLVQAGAVGVNPILNVVNESFSYISVSTNTPQTFKYDLPILSLKGSNTSVTSSDRGNLSIGTPLSSNLLEINQPIFVAGTGTITSQHCLLSGVGTQFLTQLNVGDTIYTTINTDVQPLYSSTLKYTNRGVVTASSIVVSVINNTSCIISRPFNAHVPLATSSFFIKKRNASFTIWDSEIGLNSSTEELLPIGEDASIEDFTSSIRGRTALVELNNTTYTPARTFFITDSSKDLGEQIRAYLLLYPSVNIILLKDTTYTWNTQVTVSQSQSLVIRTQDYSNGWTPTNAATINMNRNSTMEYVLGGSYPGTRKVVRKLNLEGPCYLLGVKINESSNDSMAVGFYTGDNAIISIGNGGSLFINGLSISSTQTIINFYSRNEPGSVYILWSTIDKSLLASSDIYAVDSYTGWSGFNLGGSYTEGTSLRIGTGLAGGTTGGVLFRDASNIIYNNVRPLITKTGSFGIGITPTQRLHVNGNALISGTVTSGSDIRWKENIKEINSAIEEINKIKTYTFNWKDKENKGKELQAGVIAQELENTALSHLVLEDNEGYKSVSYTGIIAYLVQAIKELNEKLTNLENNK